MDAKSIVATELEESAQQFIEIFTRLPEEMINVIPFPESWTAGQLGNHIVKATAAIPDEKTSAPERAPDQQIGLIKSVFLNFEMQYRSPDFIVPDNGPFGKQQLLIELNRNKENNINSAITKDLEALCLDFELRHFGYLTRYEWLKLIIYHTQRHSRQLRKIVEMLQLVHTG
jgi:hypothetical protein